MENYKTLNRIEKRALIEQIIQDCHQIAHNYIVKWEPIDEKWDIVEGCCYLRLSDDKQVAVERGSLEQQIHIAISEVIIRSKSDQINYKISKFFIEPGITGKHDRRLEFSKLKRDINRGTCKFVVIKEISRITREGMIWKKFFLLCIEKGCEIFIRSLPINPNDPAQILQLDILAAFAEYESNQISKRTRESNFSAMVTSGKFNSTHQVLGLDQLEICGAKKVGFYVANSSELKTVEWIMRTFLKYGSQQKTLEECAKLRLLNKNGRPFSEHSLNTLLKNKKYIGKWEINPENKGKNPQKLLPYDLFAEIDLPHGCVIDKDLWLQVQKKLGEIANKKHKNMCLTRVYPLSGVLRFQDGTPFHGKSAWGNGKSRIHYYSNKNIQKPIRVETLENEVKKTVAEIVQKSPKLNDAIKKRLSDGKTLSSLLDGQIVELENRIVILNLENRKMDQRYDSLLDGASDSELKEFKEEYKAKRKNSFNQICQHQEVINKLKKQILDVERDAFNWNDVTIKAQRIQELLQENDPIALKEAYRGLFSAIIVGKEDASGMRTLKYILKDDDIADSHFYPPIPPSDSSKKVTGESSIKNTAEFSNLCVPESLVVQAEKSCVEGKLG